MKFPFFKPFSSTRKIEVSNVCSKSSFSHKLGSRESIVDISFGEIAFEVLTALCYIFLSLMADIEYLTCLAKFGRTHVVCPSDL